jgi:hypothetical protein
MAVSPVQKQVSSADLQSTAVSRSVSVSRPSAAPPPHSETVRFSPQGDLLNKLATLQHQDPVKFQEMAQDMVAKLRGAAMSAGEGSNGPLIRLADRLTAMAHSTASKTLRPDGTAPASGSKAGSGVQRNYQLYGDTPEPREVLDRPEKDAIVEALHRVNEALAQTPEQAAAKRIGGG